MTRQVLDLGDEVTTPLCPGESVRIVAASGMRLRFLVCGASTRALWVPQDEVTRVGAPIQAGDFVRVEGVVSLMPGMTQWSPVKWPVAVVADVSQDLNEALIAPMHRTSLYRCDLSALSRIRKAEALP